MSTSRERTGLEPQDLTNWKTEQKTDMGFVAGKKSSTSVTLPSPPHQVADQLEQLYAKRTLTGRIKFFSAGEDVTGVDLTPEDNLSEPITSVTKAAVSTTTPIEIAAPGVYRKARLTWRNISAGGSPKLYVGANAPNATRGLMQSQSAKRRDAEIALGDSLMLVSGEPITSLVFSADSSVAINTHQLMISWGN